jgi:hypothetical protein
MSHRHAVAAKMSEKLPFKACDRDEHTFYFLGNSQPMRSQAGKATILDIKTKPRIS